MASFILKGRLAVLSVQQMDTVYKSLSELGDWEVMEDSGCFQFHFLFEAYIGAHTVATSQKQD